MSNWWKLTELVNDFIPTVKQPVELSIRDCQNLTQGLLEALDYIFILLILVRGKGLLEALDYIFIVSSFNIFILAREKVCWMPYIIFSHFPLLTFSYWLILMRSKSLLHLWYLWYFPNVHCIQQSGFLRTIRLLKTLILIMSSIFSWLRCRLIFSMLKGMLKKEKKVKLWNMLHSFGVENHF